MKIHPEVTVGHIHLSVSDLNRSLSFYKDILGFEITTWYGDSAVFLSAGGYHHHIGLNTWQSKGGHPAPFGSTGLYHVAFLYPSRLELAKAVLNIVESGYPIDGTADHGVSEAVYLRDPDGNGVELYVDRPKADWPTLSDGSIDMYTEALDLNSLLAEIKD